MVLLPNLFLIATKKGAKVAKTWTSQGEDGVWEPKFVRNFNDWEMGEVQHLLETLSRKIIFPHVLDKLIWEEDFAGSFTIKTYYAELEGEGHLTAPVVEQDSAF